MGSNVDEIKVFVRRLDWKGLKKVLDTQSASSEFFSEILLLVWQADSIVRRRPGDDGVKRDRFLEQLGAYYLSRGIATAIDQVQQMRLELVKIDRGYEEIHSVVSKIDSARFSSEQRVSGALAAVDAAMRNVLKDLERKINSSNGVLGVDRNVQGADQKKYDPNSNIHGLTVAVGDVVMLEAYSQGWFDTEGRVLLPYLAPAEKGVAEAVVANLMNANMWRLWKGIDERVRFLGGSLTQISYELSIWKERVEADGGPKLENDYDVAFEFEPEKRSEVLDILATERFDTILEQNFRKLLLTTNVVEKVSQSSGFVELSPKGYVSVDEVHTVLMFGHLTKMDAWKAKSDVLSIAEIIRGYAVLKKFVETLDEEENTYTPRISYARLHAELTRCGLTPLAADSFIERATFQRSSRDLYDQPLVKTTDDNFFIFGPSLLLADFIKIIFSSLANEGANFEEKGGMYEAATIEMLLRYGFEPRKLKVRRGENKEHEFDFDVAFTWGDHVFFLECKNRGLPMGNPIAIYRFNNELQGHIKQVERLKQGLVDYPDILEKDFPEAVGKKAIFCLVNALPFAIGELDGVYIVDDSIVARFFESPTFGVTAGRLDGKGTKKRTELRRIWKGSEPTVEEFISYLANPPQLVMAKENYEMTPSIECLSDRACAKVVDFKRKDLNAEDVARFLRAGGPQLLRKIDRFKVKSGKNAAKSKKATIKAARKARAENRSR
ncbi:hypothetical protein [Pseudomonas sp. C32]|uniref:hypothetical protein n=1 Tax=Pseudomonas sp. C32 TaxID=1529208 RepID=UPI0026051BD0|nr:hypothetical protein [Pseudomonas sp. C32]MDN4546385.1 hypothetical protein [Pseudomonas sp. C32]